jgi:hypothetical protein
MIVMFVCLSGGLTSISKYTLEGEYGSTTAATLLDND